MKPIDAFLRAWQWCWPRDNFKKPGWVIERQNPEVREALQRLTSDDLNKIRVDRWELGE